VVQQRPESLLQEVEILTEGRTLFAPQRHHVLPADVNLPRLRKIVIETHEQHPADFESLLGLRGVGPAAIRSLSLLAEIIFSAPPSTATRPRRSARPMWNPPTRGAGPTTRTPTAARTGFRSRSTARPTTATSPC